MNCLCVEYSCSVTAEFHFAPMDGVHMTILLSDLITFLNIKYMHALFILEQYIPKVSVRNYYCFIKLHLIARKQ
jgi:hypothetical protein